MLKRSLTGVAIVACCWVAACGSDENSNDGSAGSSAGGKSGSGGKGVSGATGGSIGSGGSGGSVSGGASGAGSGGSGGSVSGGTNGGSVSGGTSGGGTGGSSTGGAATDGGIDAGAGASGGGAGGGSGGAGGGAVVGNPALFTESVFEMDFSQGQNGRFRANGGAWQDFGAWNNPGNNGSWRNVGVSIQTTTEVRTEVVTNALGSGRVLRTWIEAGDQWRSGAAYPRTELTSSYTANVPFRSEWRLEMPFYVAGDVATTGSSIAGFQFHHNGNTGSPPFAFGIKDGTLGFWIEEAPSGPNINTPIFPLRANSLVQLVVELKFGYVADGAYVRLWANGTKYIDITNKNIGYPDLESTAGYWKFCSLYDWENNVKVSRSVYSGPVFKLLKRP